METIIDVLYFLKGVQFINNDVSEDYRNFHNIRKVKVDGFLIYDTHNLVDILNLFDLLRLVMENQDDDRVLDVDIDRLRENIFQLIKEGKHNTCFVNKLAYTQIKE